MAHTTQSPSKLPRGSTGRHLPLFLLPAFARDEGLEHDRPGSPSQRKLAMLCVPANLLDALQLDQQQPAASQRDNNSCPGQPTRGTGS
eukprot:6466363-Amphidinium_carterae.1